MAHVNNKSIIRSKYVKNTSRSGLETDKKTYAQLMRKI